MTEKGFYNSKLQKAMNKRFSKVEQEQIGFYNDTETERLYSWNCKYKGVKFSLHCNKKTGIVTYEKH